MAKGDYFFPLYYQRLLTSTIGWKDDEFGAYVKLLIYQYDNGFIPKDIEQIARISATAKKSWELIGKKFIEKDGVLINPVMDQIRSKRKKKGDTNKKNGEKGGRPKNPNDNPNETQKEPTGLFIETQTETNTNMVNGLLVNGCSEGGAGETWVWEAEKDKFMQGGDWIFNFCRSKKLTANQFDAIAKEFLTDLELKEDYKPLKEIRSHFTSWFNKNKDKILSNISVTKNGSSARELEEKANRIKLGIDGK